jgi:hypothetical protein
MNDKEFVIEKLRETGREGIEDLIKFLEDSDFFTAPASTRYHGAYTGGLVEHSVNVYDTMLALDKMLFEEYSVPKCDANSLILVSLLHDVTKIGTYKLEQKWRKDANGKWESYTGYSKKADFEMGHAAKSVFLIQQYIKLTPEEAQAIFWHMGAYDTSEYTSYNGMGEAFTKNSMAYKLHTADMMATYIVENETLNNTH